MKAGDILSMPVGCKHTVYADTELKLMEVQLGKDISVGDKIKHEYAVDTRCFGAGDIRGIYPDQVNEEMAYRIGRYFPQVLAVNEEAARTEQDKKAEASGNVPLRIAIGHDIRLSGQDLSDALMRGLAESGCQVVDIGQCGTEMIYFATAHLGLDGGIMITASHNPKGYNGFKLVGKSARPISQDSGLVELEKLCSHEPPKAAGTASMEDSQVQHYDIMPEYIAHLLSYVDLPRLRQAVADRGGFRVAVNPGNGGAGAVLDKLAKQLPFEFIKVNYNPDGSFPNGVPNPILNENREATASVVRQAGADVGIAWDGDFDRCFIFDENGNMIEGAYMVGFLAEAFLQKNPGARIIHDPRVYWNTQDICQRYGGEAVLCRSGHSFIKAMMRQVDAVYGGEMSAHHYFRDFAYCDSGMIPWLLVLELLVYSGQKMSQLIARRQELFPCSGEINTKGENMEQAAEILKKAEAAYSDGAIDHVDGLSVAYPQWRFNLRRSNTEPVIRLNVETRGNRQLLKKKTEELLDLIRG